MNVTNEVNMDLVVDVTENEAVALITCLNYSDLPGQLSDNFSNGGSEEFRHALGWSKHQVAGLIGSLEKKGLGELDENEGNGDIFWLTEKGIHTAFFHLAKKEEVEEEVRVAPAEEEALPAPEDEADIQVDPEVATRLAVEAALRVIDLVTDGSTKKSTGPCGDKLAYSLHNLILEALKEELGVSGE